MNTRKILEFRPEEEVRCIGVLLHQCPVPVARCHQCWFATDKGEPTLVRVEVFKQIQAQKFNDALETA